MLAYFPVVVTIAYAAVVLFAYGIGEFIVFTAGVMVGVVTAIGIERSQKEAYPPR